MIKKFIKATIVGASLFAMVGNAGADTNINIYGASAQYKFWNSAAGPFLKDTTQGPGCTASFSAEGADDTNQEDHGITKGTGCVSGDATWYIRYSSKASFDGIRSMQGIEGSDTPTACTNKRQREMADETQTDWGTGLVSGLTCKTVTVGASDVEANAIAGMYSYGHRTYDQTTDEVEKDMTSSTIYDTGLDNYRPIIVPFAFFAETNVPYTNMTKLMAAHLFSGAVKKWSSFGATAGTYDNVTLCMRHAGSGTHATLNAVVLDGVNILEEEVYGGTGSYNVFFNEESTDLMNCLAAYPGSVGYADADKNASNKWPTVGLMTYQGVSASKANITNGMYPFWAAQWLYVTSKTTDDPVDKLAVYASKGDNMPSSRDPYWAAADEMKVNKSNSFSFPVRTAP